MRDIRFTDITKGQAEEPVQSKLEGNDEKFKKR